MLKYAPGRARAGLSVNTFAVKDLLPPGPVTYTPTRSTTEFSIPARRAVVKTS